MNETSSRETCVRENELISVLYGEATEHESREFQEHLSSCATCQAEITSFGQLRESIDAWKLEALSGFTTPQVATQFQRSKSAFAALRQFFDLSPLWLKGATAFAALLFVMFAVLAFGKFRGSEPKITTVKSDAIYTEEEKNLIVQKALEGQKASLLAGLQPKSEVSKAPVGVHRPQRSGIRSISVANGKRPLSRWEREQLAADLRLLQESDEDGLELLGDRINQPED